MVRQLRVQFNVTIHHVAVLDSAQTHIYLNGSGQALLSFHPEALCDVKPGKSNRKFRKCFGKIHCSRHGTGVYGEDSIRKNGFVSAHVAGVNNER